LRPKKSVVDHQGQKQNKEKPIHISCKSLFVVIFVRFR
jgi:hypothetical protein